MDARLALEACALLGTGTMADVPDDDKPRVLFATDLSAASAPALIRARDHARAVNAFLVVCHIVPGGIHNNALFPQSNEADTLALSDLLKRAGDLVDEQLSLFSISPDETKIIIESGGIEEEIVRIAEEERATLVVIGARERVGIERRVGHIAERIVRYSHAPVLIARDTPRSGRILVATDFSDASSSAHEQAAMLVKTAGVDATLLHVGGAPPSPTGAPGESCTATLTRLCAQYGFGHSEQVDGEAAAMIVERARTLSAEMIVIGSRGRTRLDRLALGSVAEAVVRSSTCSVLVARPLASSVARRSSGA